MENNSWEFSRNKNLAGLWYLLIFCTHRVVETCYMQSHACYCHWHSAVVCNHGFLYAVETWPTCAMQSLCMQICINRRASTCYWLTCSLEIQKWVTCSHISFNCHFHFQLRICRIYCVLFFVSSNQWQKISRKRYMRLWKKHCQRHYAPRRWLL